MKQISGGAICGGVISKTMEKRLKKKYGVWACMMQYTMPDDKFEQYVEAKKSGDDKKSHKLFAKYAHSKI